MSNAVRTVRAHASPIIPAAIDTARNASGVAQRHGFVAREADLLPVPYFHLVFRLPAELGPIALQNKALVYGLLLKVAADTLISVAGDRNHLGARIGVTAVLHTWGQHMQHHPHVHCIVPGGGISPDGERWVACKPGFPYVAVACCQISFGGCFWTVSPQHSMPGNWYSLTSSSISKSRRRSLPPSRPCGQRSGRSMPKRLWAVPSRYWAIFPGTLTASQSLTTAWSISTTRTLLSNQKMLGRVAVRIARSCDWRSPNSSVVSSSTSSRTDSSAFVITAFLPTAIALTSSRFVASCLVCLLC